ncbi:phage tail protein [Sphingomonas faeni]|uniref:phage tail protein n=1 Tax=Sphingomonas faeni TaxID=185950 RepID=UPI00334C19D2
MATLVLTAVGSAVGGPIGGAIGALIGQSVDHALFAPKRREGPRLVELAVQTSSYGSQIPKLFGTMRVAGTVIWASDLIETRASSRRGKGQPSTSTYSYAASFAVLLSARAIRGVGRIWAEGKLLRGAAGDFKTATGFRLHLGGEDQAVDPLIASAEGAASPAYRGAAYAVFEMLQLADFGNRIPSLTFEVMADEGSVPVSTIAKALAQEVSGTAALTVGGFAASGGSVRAVLEMLGHAGGAWFAPSGTGLVMRDTAGAAVTVADEGFAASGKGVRRARAVAAIETVPRSLTVGYYDAARDYQAGVQRARRPGAGLRDERIEVPAVLEAGAAKTVAEAMLARAEAGRVRRTVAAGFGAMAIAPGACVTIVDERGASEGGVWRVTDVSIEGMATILGLVPLVAASLPATATSGRVSKAADAVIGATIVHAFEIPGLEEAPLTAPRMTVVAAGTGAAWRQAALLYSLDDGVSWVTAGATAAPAVLGTIAGVASGAPATLIDLRGAFEVVLAHADMTLGDADAAALDRGENLALLGDELVQFGRAEPLGGARWRLSGLLRGRRGSEAAAGTQGIGDRFAVLETGAARAFDLPVSVLAREVRVMASGVGDATPVETRCLMTGASVVPPSPVHLDWHGEADGGATVWWTRRSRAGWRWIDGVDAPLAEETEAYRVTVATATGTREIEVVTPSAAVTAEERAGVARVTVRQRGVFGESRGTGLIVPA